MPGKDGEAGDVGPIVDTAGCSQVEKGPLEARSGFPTEPSILLRVAAWEKVESLGLALLLPQPCLPTSGDPALRCESQWPRRAPFYKFQVSSLIPGLLLTGNP